jgi:hypothetical protein
MVVLIHIQSDRVNVRACGPFFIFCRVCGKLLSRLSDLLRDSQDGDKGGDKRAVLRVPGLRGHLEKRYRRI